MFFSKIPSNTFHRPNPAIGPKFTLNCSRAGLASNPIELATQENF